MVTANVQTIVHSSAWAQHQYIRYVTMKQKKKIRIRADIKYISDNKKLLFLKTMLNRQKYLSDS